jgi:hypothetical protein
VIPGLDANGIRLLLRMVTDLDTQFDQIELGQSFALHADLYDGDRGYAPREERLRHRKGYAVLVKKMRAVLEAADPDALSATLARWLERGENGRDA